MRRVFREYKVLLITPGLTRGTYENMLTPLDFGEVVHSTDDQRAVPNIKKMKPDLVAACMSQSVFTGAQLLSAARNEPELDNVPFLIMGSKEDIKKGMAEHVEKAVHSKFAPLPMDQEEFNAALLELLDPLLDADKEEAYRLIDLAEEKTESGDLIEAVDAYEKALQLYDTHIEAWLKMGALLADLEAYDEAETAYFRALSTNQYSLTAYIGLADVYERRQEYDQTVSVLQQALGVAKMLQVSAKSVSRINYFIGEFELRLKRLTGAEEAFDRAIADDPVDAELRMDIGDSYAGKGYYAESEKHYQAALRIDPNLAHVYNRLGIAYRKQQKFQKALALYESAKYYHPDDEHLMFNIARAHVEDVNEDKAEEVLAEALSISPNFKEARRLLLQISNPGEKPESLDQEGNTAADGSEKQIWERSLDDVLKEEG